jgi:hypothetical protein
MQTNLQSSVTSLSLVLISFLSLSHASFYVICSDAWFAHPHTTRPNILELGISVLALAWQEKN